VALTPDERVYRQLALFWGVVPIRSTVAEDIGTMLAEMESKLLECDLAQPKDLVLVVGAMPLEVGVHTNFVKAHQIGGV
jgi:pyruvate kinase